VLSAKPVLTSARQKLFTWNRTIHFHQVRIILFQMVSGQSTASLPVNPGQYRKSLYVGKKFISQISEEMHIAGGILYQG